MKKFNKIIALTTALVLALSTGAFASVEEDIKRYDAEFKEEVNYIEDVYKYDLSLTKEEEKEEDVKEEIEVLKNGKAAGIVDALGLIKKNSLGFFREDEILSVENFLEIANTLIGFSYDYEELTFVTHDTALRLAMRAAGYDFLPTDAKMMEKAYRLRILDGINFNPEKYITRGEMAVLLYNILNTDVVELTDASGSRLNFETTKDATLMQQIYGYEVVDGLVTGANGIDIYANRTVPENTIEIDRVSYWYDKDDIETNTLFGHKAYGLIDVRNDNELVFVEVDASEDFITVSFDDIVDSGSYISWQNAEGDGKVKTSNINRVVVNGVTYMGNSAIDEVESGEGTISFTKSARGNYDIAIINKYETYKVNRYSERDQKLYFEDGRKFGEYDYIDAGDSGYEFVNVLIDGKAAKIADITANHMVSIFDNGSNFIQIEATSAVVDGKIDQMYDEDTVVIGDKLYTISPAYEDAIESGASFSPVSIGMEATFRLNVVGNLAYVSKSEDQYRYAIIRKAGSVDSTFSSDVCIRMFNDNGDWVETNLAKKVTIDGKKYTDQETAAAYVEGIKDDIASTIIRYKLNSDGKITFLDTKISTSYEADDINALREDHTWEGKIEWTKGKTLNDTKYKLKEGATIFYVPDDADDEAEYAVMEQKALTAESQATLVLYNTDDYFRSNIAIFSGRPSSTFNDPQFFLVTNVRKGVDEQGRDILVLKGLDTVRSGENPGFMEKTLKTTASIAKLYPDIKPGDVIRRALDGNGDINSTAILMDIDDVPTMPETFTALATVNKWDTVWGTMEKISPSDGMALISVNGEAYSFTAVIAAVFDCKTKKGENIALSDIQPGDKAYIFGNWGSDSVVIYRNIPTN